MAKCFQQSDEAYTRGQDVLGEELLEQGEQHERTMEALNAEASKWIFQSIYIYRVSVSGLMSDIGFGIVQRTTWFVDAISYCAWLVSNHFLTRTE